MDSLASSSVKPPAEGLEDIEILPFNNTAKFKKAIAEHLQAVEDGEKDGESVREWMVFSDFDSSKLKLIDNLRYPIRLQLDGGNTLVVKMVHPVHEAMHGGLLELIKDDMRSMGLRYSHDYIYIYGVVQGPTAIAAERR
jgi:hypothetical protein